jgi:hypothetical protein
MPEEDDTPQPRRILAMVFQFHRFCGDARCKRAKACKGDDPVPCFDQLWPLVPETDKIVLRVYITESHRGAPPAEALAKAKGAVALHAAHNEPRPAPQPAAKTEAPPPRVRML